MADEPIYHKLTTETAKAYEAFSIYRDMGVGRSITRVAQELNKSRTQIGIWSERHNWVNRVQEFDKVENRERQEQALRLRTLEHKKKIKQFAESYTQHGRNSMRAALLGGNIQIAYLEKLNKEGIERDYETNQIIGIKLKEDGTPVISKDDVMLANQIVRSAAPDADYWAKALRIDEDFLAKLQRLDDIEGDDGEV
jgi:hypothetical protein